MGQLTCKKSSIFEEDQIWMIYSSVSHFFGNTDPDANTTKSSGSNQIRIRPPVEQYGLGIGM